MNALAAVKKVLSKLERVRVSFKTPRPATTPAIAAAGSCSAAECLPAQPRVIHVRCYDAED